MSSATLIISHGDSLLLADDWDLHEDTDHCTSSGGSMGKISESVVVGNPSSSPEAWDNTRSSSSGSSTL
jgi:hypothetical protein